MERILQADRRRALVVANAHYDDEALDRLTSPAEDAAALAHVLEDPQRCSFEVASVVEGNSGEVIEAVEEFLTDVERDDLLLLYFSCHGLKDEHGRLYFAARNTRRNRLRSTAVSATVVNDLLLGSRSRRKVLLLDCCYGGAFAKGMHVKADRAVHTSDHFDARGLVVLTASDATQYAFEGEVVRGSVTPSRFTATLVEGLSSGAADLDRDGFVSVDDAYDFVRRRLADDGLAQTPRKWEFDVAGHIVLARTEAAAEAGLEPSPPPSDAGAPLPAARAPTGALGFGRPASWLASLTMVVGCVAPSWLLVTWLNDLLGDTVSAEYLPDLDVLRWSLTGLAAAWAFVYALIARPSGSRNRVRWGDPWRPLLNAYRDLFGSNGTGSIARGLVAALPVNVLLVGAASVVAGALAYGASGSELREGVFRLAFALLAVGGLVRYLTWPRSGRR